MKRKRELLEADPVKLGPIFGMRAGKALLIIFTLSIVLLFFLLCMLPGLLKGGKYVSFNSPLTEVGVYLDGTYLGSSAGSRYYITSGEHDVVYVKNSIKIGEERIRISRPVFFTLFSHPSSDIEIVYTDSSELKNSINRAFLREVSAWSKVTEFKAPVTLPPIFTNYAKDITELNMALDDEIWMKAVMHISSAEMLDDYIKACEILSINPIIDGSIFTPDTAPQFNRYHDSTKPAAYDESFVTYGPAEFEMGSYLGDSYPLINEKRISVSTGKFSIALRPVSEYEYALFTEENPEWSVNNKDNLIKEGLVDENYLRGIVLSTNYISSRPIRNISYYAAASYIEWLSEKDGIEYRLPSEAEWSYAAYSVQEKRYATSLNWADMDLTKPQMMMGGIWEFTETEYVPLSRLLGYDGYSIENDDVVIKGGSYINSADVISADTTGLMSKARCSDYTGFRIVK